MLFIRAISSPIRNIFYIRTSYINFNFRDPEKDIAAKISKRLFFAKTDFYKIVFKNINSFIYFISIYLYWFILPVSTSRILNIFASLNFVPACLVWVVVLDGDTRRLDTRLSLRQLSVAPVCRHLRYIIHVRDALKSEGSNVWLPCFSQVRDLDQCEDIEVGAKRPAEAQAVEQVSNSATAVKSRRCARKVLRKIAVMSTLLSALVACGALVYYFLGWKALVQLVLIAVIVYGIVEKKYRWFYVALMTAPRDIT